MNCILHDPSPSIFLSLLSHKAQSRWCWENSMAPALLPQVYGTWAMSTWLDSSPYAAL